MKFYIRNKKFEVIKINNKPIGVQCELNIHTNYWDNIIDISTCNKGIGKSYCSDKDTFDYNKGKKLAETRATLNAISETRKKIYSAYSTILREFKDGINKINNMHESEKSHVKYLKEKY